MQIKISAVVLTKNEEKNIKVCLKSLLWCDEIIVIDDGSKDKTVEIARSMGAEVFTHPINGDFSAQRNYGLSIAKGDWILFLDADERIPSALWYEITQYITGRVDGYSGFFIKRKDLMWGKEQVYGEVGSIKLLRMAKKNSGLWEGKVHEVWKIKGKTLTLHNSLRHYPHDNVEEFLKEINFYTDLQSAELFNRGIKVHWWSIILYPKAKFILNYIVRGGFLDGLPGLVFAVIMSFHSFLVRSKLWAMWNKK